MSLTKSQRNTTNVWFLGNKHSTFWYLFGCYRKPAEKNTFRTTYSPSHHHRTASSLLRHCDARCNPTNIYGTLNYSFACCYRFFPTMRHVRRENYNGATRITLFSELYVVNCCICHLRVTKAPTFYYVLRGYNFSHELCTSWCAQLKMKKQSAQNHFISFTVHG